MRRFLPVGLVVVLVLAGFGVGFLGGHQVRDLSAAPSAASESRPAGRTPGPTPSVLGGATQPPTGAATTSAPAATAARVAAALRGPLSSARLGPNRGYAVLDAATGSVLADGNGGVGFTPASTTKLTTAAAILTAAATTDRFTTVVRAGATAGQIVLVGGGDPTLSAARPGRAALYPEAARLSALAAQIRAARPGQRITSIVVDDSRFTGAATAPGWAAEDVPSSYMSAVYPLVVDGGRPAGGGEQRSASPDLEAGRALATLLGVPTVPVTRGRAPSGAAQLGTVRSAPMLTLVEQMLKDSDNVIAELLGREVAVRGRQPASFAGTTAAVRTALANLGVARGVDLVDASGLSVRDRIEPRALTSLLLAIVGNKRAGVRDIVNAMPVAGWDGTLNDRYVSGAVHSAAGDIRAKTGSLTGVDTLAGVVHDRSGRLLIFTFMADQVPGAQESGAPVLDAAAAALAAL